MRWWPLYREGEAFAPKIGLLNRRDSESFAPTGTFSHDPLRFQHHRYDPLSLSNTRKRFGDRSSGGGDHEVLVVVLELGEAPPLHQHDDAERIFYVLEGKGILTIGELAEHFNVKPGDVVRIPPSTLHSIKCDGATTLRYLSVDAFVGEKPQSEPTWDAT